MKIFTSQLLDSDSVVCRLLAPFFKPIYSGIGCILMLHRVTEANNDTYIDSYRRLVDTSPDFLERLIRFFRKQKYVFVSLDEVHDILLHPRSAPKFVAFTFDDGYKDVYTTALPVLAEANVPFTLYLTTGIPDKTLIPWAHLLEKLLCRKEQFAFEFDNHYFKYVLHDDTQRELAFSSLSAFFKNLSTDNINRLAHSIFEEEDIRTVVRKRFITWDEIIQMSNHPLATIGAHTLNHPRLCHLSPEDAQKEMLESKLTIESRIGKPVRHFAYPYGSSYDVNEREFSLAKECGFDTATTTRLANIFPGHVNGLHRLPRIFGANLRELEIAVSGTVSAIRNRGKRYILD